MAAEAPPDVEVLDVFVIDDHGNLVTAEPRMRPAARARRTPASDDGHERQAAPPRTDFSATPGFRMGVPATTTIRPFRGGDVFLAVFVAPALALERLLAEDPFAAIDDLDVDPDSRRVDGHTVTWSTTVHMGRWHRPRTAELCIHPSASWVLTVLELRPDRRRSLRTDPFIQRGVAAVDAIGRDLLSAVSEGRTREPPPAA